MTLKYYDLYLTTSTTPQEYFEESMQALSDSQFDNASDILTVRLQNRISLVFEDIIARVTSVSKSKNIGNAYINDNYKQIIFKDFTQLIYLGDVFQFKDFYWIVININNINSVTKSCVVRKCNLNPFYYKVGNQVYNTYGYYEKNMYTDENNNAINLPNDVVMVTIPFNLNIKESDCFYIFGSSWHERYSVNDIDRSKKDGNYGLLIIRATKEQSDITPQEYYSLNPVSPTIGKVTVTPSTLSLTLNTTKQLTFAIYDKNDILMPDEMVTWTSSNATIATVSSSGLVTAKQIGSCEIVASSVTDSNIVGKCVLSCIDDGGGWY